MRKRKPPIVPITILVVMASVAFGLNYAWSKSAGPGAEQHQAPPPDVKPVGEARPAESKESVAASIKNAVGGQGGVPQEARDHMPPGAPGAGPLILNPRSQTTNAKPAKPKPNPTATSTQWYLDK